MAYRNVRGSDPFASKTTRNERFAQMSKQEQLIEHKKREIQRKLDEQKKKESDEALRKLQNAAAAKAGLGKSTLGSLGLKNGVMKGNIGSKSAWKGLDQQKWNRERDFSRNAGSRSGHSDGKVQDESSNTPNAFSNDGSFLDQFKKISGGKAWIPPNKDVKKEDEINSDSPRTGSTTKRERDSANSDGERNNRRSSFETHRTDDDRRTARRDDDRRSASSRRSRDSRHNRDSWNDGNESPPHKSRHFQSPPPHTNRPSSPYSPSKETPDMPSTHASPVALPTSANQSRFMMHHAPALPMSVPPPNTQSKPPPPLVNYSAPPPPLHSIPPPLPIQPHSIPAPSPLLPHSIPPPPSLPIPSHPPPSLPVNINPMLNVTLPPPAPARSLSIPSNVPPPQLGIPMPSNVPPPMLHTLPPRSVPQYQLNAPPPMTSVPPAGILPPRSVPQYQLSAPPPMTSVPPPLPTITCVSTAMMQRPPPVVSVSACPPTPSAVASAFQTGVSSTATASASDAAATAHLNTQVETDQMARMVAQCGDDIEDIIRIRNPNDHALWFLRDKNSAAYLQFRSLVLKYRNEDGIAAGDAAVKVEPGFHDEGKGFAMQKHEFQSFTSQPPPLGLGFVNRKPDIKQETFKQETESENAYGPEGGVKRSSEDADEAEARRKKRRSRWAPESVKVETMPPVGLAVNPAQGQLAPITPSGSGGGPMISKITRSDPALIQYAVQSFGSTNLSEEDWKKAEDHYKINLLYHDMLRKREELDRLTRAGKFKYEYDSDEETDGGTWEHRLRSQEMLATQIWADELTKKAEGKHHIGDFLPPDELERFMEKYTALQAGREPDLSDYKEFKLKEDNIGFKMLQKLGWSEGQGLGMEGAGITDPVNKASNHMENQGLGLERPDDVSGGDDEFEAYRKRMMLAYRFRPNPLNNPRRSYY